MLATEAIVLSLQKKSDHSSLLHLFTRTHGRILCMVYGIQTSKKRSTTVSRTILYPLSWLDVQLKEIPQKNLYILSSAQPHYVPHTYWQDVERQCVSLFMAEALSKVIRHSMADEPLFDFLTEQLLLLDTSDSIQYIYNQFLTDLSIHLGYGGEPMEELQNLHSLNFLDYIFPNSK